MLMLDHNLFKKYREVPRWLQPLMRIPSALLVALGSAAALGKLYRPPHCYHCLREEAGRRV